MMKTTAAKERIARVGEHSQVVVPREFIQALKLRAGDMVAFSKQKNGVLIKAKRVPHADDTLTPQEAKTVRRGEAQLTRGDSKPWRAIKNALPR